jgi:hypothetical protein
MNLEDFIIMYYKKNKNKSKFRKLLKKYFNGRMPKNIFSSYKIISPEKLIYNLDLFLISIKKFTSLRKNLHLENLPNKLKIQITKKKINENLKKKFKIKLINEKCIVLDLYELLKFLILKKNFFFKISFDSIGVYQITSLTILNENSQKLKNIYIISIFIGKDNFNSCSKIFSTFNDQIKKINKEFPNCKIIFMADLKAYYCLYNETIHCPECKKTRNFFNYVENHADKEVFKKFIEKKEKEKVIKKNNKRKRKDEIKEKKIVENKIEENQIVDLFDTLEKYFCLMHVIERITEKQLLTLLNINNNKKNEIEKFLSNKKVKQNKN